MNFVSQIWGKSGILDFILKIFGVYLIYLIPIFLILYWFLGDKKSAIRTTIAGFFAWGVMSKLIQVFYFRPRPFTFVPEKEIIFHRPDYSFPSDHAALLFALAFSFYLSKDRRTAFWIFILGTILSLCRVILGLHWLTDILAGWALGMISALSFWLLKEPFDKYISEPIIWLAKKIKLA